MDDVDQGNAVFCQQSSEGAQPSALDVLIPQYALWRGEDGDLPSILVQAEAHIHDPQGDPIFGLKTFDGNALVADGSEVVLLGQNLPD
ncbi:hypothetical protein [Novosphingobium sp. UBA1939]|uniref:hypothetical protein n=1 Tax=Novosphingobium sp. UBA1939 TaxID=1946982 RepID=UPI0025F4EDF7|nr:hypothetical protein [Novosphingobium sp. UBA1939]